MAPAPAESLVETRMIPPPVLQNGIHSACSRHILYQVDVAPQHRFILHQEENKAPALELEFS